jgi:hypothetical protein
MDKNLMILFVKDATSRACDGNYIKIMTVPVKFLRMPFWSAISPDENYGVPT